MSVIRELRTQCGMALEALRDNRPADAVQLLEAAAQVNGHFRPPVTFPERVEALTRDNSRNAKRLGLLSGVVVVEPHGGSRFGVHFGGHRAVVALLNEKFPRADLQKPAEPEVGLDPAAPGGDFTPPAPPEAAP